MATLFLNWITKSKTDKTLVYSFAANPKKNTKTVVFTDINSNSTHRPEPGAAEFMTSNDVGGFILWKKIQKQK